MTVYGNVILIYQSMAAMISGIFRVYLLFSYCYSSQGLHLKGPQTQPPFSASAEDRIITERIETNNIHTLLTLFIVGRKIPFCALGEDDWRMWTAISNLRMESRIIIMYDR